MTKPPNDLKADRSGQATQNILLHKERPLRQSHRVGATETPQVHTWRKVCWQRRLHPKNNARTPVESRGLSHGPLKPQKADLTKMIHTPLFLLVSRRTLCWRKKLRFHVRRKNVQQEFKANKKSIAIFRPKCQLRGMSPVRFT